MIRSNEEIKERINRLKQNIDIIRNNQGKSNVLVMINTLQEYLDNPQDIDYLINNSSGQRKQTLKWIGGYAE
jgi:hypothetical protein